MVMMVVLVAVLLVVSDGDNAGVGSGDLRDPPGPANTSGPSLPGSLLGASRNPFTRRTPDFKN